ncbi:hypothetical protein LOZ58_001244 [Ophidiomyces ophidiicola]|nr:hypothetical protein LOZ65_003124 [Ophidiomyces ophidiicola]KAI1936339.1 hypothetical protein LOZ66_004799 [Ophidiomyces ophidiicola]KAI1965397.1 hypothetical protein LOZ58_001244 [Ophidiomyces ophidiicola]
MRFILLGLLSALPAFAAAAAPPNNAGQDFGDEAKVEMFSSDTCGGAVDSAMVVGSGSYRCIAVTNKRSIKAPVLNGCEVRTFSGNNCRGSNFRLPDRDCHSVLYASVEIKC